jgi:hypothetical protein
MNSSRCFVAASALAACAVSLPASAFPLSIAALPSGTQVAPPARKAAPHWIAASQVAPGLYRVDTDQLLRRGLSAFQETVVFDDQARAEEFESQLTRGGELPFRRSDSCFSTPSSFRIPEQADARDLDWDLSSANRFTGQSHSRDRGPMVLPVRVQRWVQVADRVQIETTVFWLDVRTGGTRLLERVRTELARVAAPFAGVVVYAHRSGDESVSFFVRRDTPEQSGTAFDPRVLQRFSGPSNGLGVDLTTLRMVSGEELRHSECAFQHVTLTASAEPAFRKRELETANIGFNVVVALEAEPVALEPADPASPVEVRGTATVRTLVVNLGLRRGEPGKPVVPTLSYGWADRARARVF